MPFLSLILHKATIDAVEQSESATAAARESIAAFQEAAAALREGLSNAESMQQLLDRTQATSQEALATIAKAQVG